MPARLQWLTVVREDAPGIVAQCNDGHPFWEGVRREGPLELQMGLAELDMLIHDEEEHAPVEYRPRKVWIATPAYSGAIDPEYVISLVRAVKELNDTCELEVHLLRGESLITRARCDMFTDFVESDADDMVFIDSDIAFSPENLTRLLNVPYELAAVPYPKKETLWYHGLEGASDVWDLYKKTHGVAVNVSEGWENNVDEFGYAPADYLGTGFMRITRKCAETIRAAYPELEYRQGGPSGAWRSGVFNTYIHNELLLSEDYAFCQRWTDIGGKMYVDVDGPPLKHLGIYLDRWELEHG